MIFNSLQLLLKHALISTHILKMLLYLIILKKS